MVFWKKKPEEKDKRAFSKLRSGLAKTRGKFAQTVKAFFAGGRKLDDEALDELADMLIAADVGPKAVDRIVEDLRDAYKERDLDSAENLENFVREEMKGALRQWDTSVKLADSPPTVFLVVGVNGTGKTTTIAKLANLFKSEGKKVILAASDTYRAAGIEQLAIWAERVGVDIIKHQRGGDPAAVAYDAVEAAIARKADILIVDTAGRLQTRDNLMRELEKVRRVIGKRLPEAPHETLLVLDATTGQNAVSQAKTFGQSVQVTGIVLSKLDGTARGGVVLGMRDEVDIPVKFIGLGEKAEDIQPFDADEFVDALLDK